MSSVDVIVPCYKYGHLLPHCVRSILEQEGVGVRVLILDDASPDRTPEMATRLAADPRVRYRRHARNQGHVATYNEGLAWAEADYTLLISADDGLTPGALLRATRVMDTHPEVGMTYGAVVTVQGAEALPPAAPCSAWDYELLTGSQFLDEACLTGFNKPRAATVVVRTGVQKRVGLYRSELPHSCDMEMWLRFAAHASVGVISTEQAYYRHHGANMSSRYLAGRGFLDLEQRRAAFEVLFRDWGHLLPDAERLRAASVCAVGQSAFWAASRAFDEGDLAACRALLDFALNVHPPLRSGRTWRRLRYKLALGHRVWSRARPVLDRLRGIRSGSASGKPCPP